MTNLCCPGGYMLIIWADIEANLIEENFFRLCTDYTKGKNKRIIPDIALASKFTHVSFMYDIIHMMLKALMMYSYN